MSYTLQQLSYSVPFTGAEYVDTSKLTPLFLNLPLFLNPMLLVNGNLARTLPV